MDPWKSAYGFLAFFVVSLTPGGVKAQQGEWRQIPGFCVNFATDDLVTGIYRDSNQDLTKIQKNVPEGWAAFNIVWTPRTGENTLRGNFFAA